MFRQYYPQVFRQLAYLLIQMKNYPFKAFQHTT